MIDIQLDDIHKVYPNGAAALRGVTLTVPAGECLALVGPSGCGKTTLLRVIAGLEQVDRGTVRLGGRGANDVPAHQRGVAMVFQRPALVPGRSVRANLAWSWTLGGRGMGHLLGNLLGRPAYSAAQGRDLEEIARLLGVDGLLDRRAGEISGGQQQRVALGQALLRRAPICLLDEPLGHLEAGLRTQLRRDLRLLSRRFPATMVHVTHDPAEALAVGDQVAILHDGRLQQIGAPAEVLHRPANRFVAEFCQPDAPLNFLDGRLHDGTFVAAPWLRLAVPAPVRARLGGRDAVTVGVPAEAIKILAGHEAVAAAGHIMQMDVALTEFAPRGIWFTCRRESVQLTGFHADAGAAIGSTVMLMINLDAAFWFDATTGVTLAGPGG